MVAQILPFQDAAQMVVAKQVAAAAAAAVTRKVAKGGKLYATARQVISGILWLLAKNCADHFQR